MAGVGPRLRALAVSPVAWAAVALFAWAGLSLLWTPFPVPGAQRLLKIAMTALAAAAVIVTARDHLRATDLYLFPIGVLVLMVTIFALWFAEQQTLEPNSARIDAGGIAMAMLLFPAMGGLAARGRNGYARTLMLLGLVYAFAIGSGPITAALLAGIAVLSFAVSDLERTMRDVGRAAVALVLAAPLLLAMSPMLGAPDFPRQARQPRSALPDHRRRRQPGSARLAAVGDRTRRRHGGARRRRRPAADDDAARRAVRDLVRTRRSSAPSPRRRASGSAFAPSAARRRDSRPIWRRPSPPT